MDTTKALLTYNLTSIPAGAFPVVVEIYSDLGVAGQWDINDSLINLTTIASAAAGLPVAAPCPGRATPGARATGVATHPCRCTH